MKESEKEVNALLLNFENGHVFVNRQGTVIEYCIYLN